MCYLCFAHFTFDPMLLMRVLLTVRWLLLLLLMMGFVSAV
jgi:hypothetical protein